MPAGVLALGDAAPSPADAVALDDGTVLAADGVVEATGDGDACAMALGDGAVPCGEVTLQLANTTASKKVKIASGRFRVKNINIL